MSTLPQDFGSLTPGILHAVANGITPATAYQLFRQITVFEVVTSGGMAQLPATNASHTALTVLNRCGTGADLLVVPDTNGEIESRGVGAGVVIPDGSNATFTCLDPATTAGRQWWLSGVT